VGPRAGLDAVKTRKIPKSSTNISEEDVAYIFRIEE
jgi:hypothetical protein